MRDDIKIRVADEKLPLSGIATDVTEFDRDGLVYEKNGVKVIAFEVDHGDVIKPCYGYRFEYGGRVAVFSSDTRYNQNVIKYGAGADLLVHEVAMRAAGADEGSLRPAHHRASHDAVRLPAVSSRRPGRSSRPIRILCSLAANECRRRRSTKCVAERGRPTSGPLVVGEDLMAFEIGETVTVSRRKP